LGEELWKKFLPKYLESLGASVAVVGLFGTSEDFFDALYQYPGGWLADHWGRRRAFLTFFAAADRARPGTPIFSEVGPGGTFQPPLARPRQHLISIRTVV
jgi:MFS family permease